MQEIDTKPAESAAQTSGNKKRLTILTIVFAIVIAGYLLFLKTFDPYHYIDLEAYEKGFFHRMEKMASSIRFLRSLSLRVNSVWNLELETGSP